MPPELVLTLPNGVDRPPLQLCVVREAGGWTRGAHVVIEAGNHLELTERELEWLIGGAGHRALEALQALRSGGQDGVSLSAPGLPSSDGPRSGSPTSSSTAGQGAPDRPEPAQPSTEETT